MVINQIMLLQGNEFIQTQRPVDFAHWLLLLGVLFCIPLNHIFSDGLFNSLASTLTSIGIVALAGQAVIDLIWWSFGTDYEGMNHLAKQIMDSPSLRIPFMTIGPSLFYLGIATHAGRFLKEHTLLSITVIAAVLITGVGSFLMDDRLIILLGHSIMAIGMSGLVFKIDNLGRNLKGNEQLANN